MTDPVLAIQGLRVTARSRRGAIVAVDDLDLEISAGEVLGLIGESGSGKTTTARAVIGLLERNVRVEAGRIWFRGEQVYGDGIDQLRSLRGRHIGMVFQDTSATLNPLLRIGTQLKQVLKANRPELSPDQTASRMKSLLSRMGFADPQRILKAYPHQLSGGMRQRAATAIAVAPEPEIIIADECTSALDMLVQADVIELLRELVHELHMAMIFVTHDLTLASDLCTHVMVMNQGKVVESGHASSVMRAPDEEYTRKLLASVPIWAASAEIATVSDGAEPPAARGVT
jgi:peptide/nickel transport system ATP-binding protein